MKNQIIVIALLVMAIVHVKAQNNENIYSMKLGDSKVILLSEGQWKGNPGILIDATPEIIEKYAPNDSFPMATNVFLWQSNGKNILFDTGYGRALFDNLQSLQIKPENIDAIFITHVHGDHIGGLIRNEKAAFPNAKLYISKSEYNYGTNESAKKTIEAYKDRLQLFEPISDPYDDTSIYPGIKAFATYGHTPGHTVYLLESDDDMLLIWGDLTHAMAVQMPYPELAVTYDSDTGKAVQSRLLVLRLVSAYNIPVAGMHIAYPGIGTIEKSEPGYKFIPVK